MKKLNIFILIVGIGLISCERDDICAEGTSTTPRLMIEFYDVDNPENLKSVTGLSIYGESPDIPIPDNDDASSAILVDPLDDNPSRVFNRNTNAAGLPLRIDDEMNMERITTRFILEKDTNLRLDTDDPETSNIDIIEISYIPQFQYVSRACGFKSIFSDLNVIFDDDGDTWIRSITVDVTTVENENTIHVRIFH